MRAIHRKLLRDLATLKAQAVTTGALVMCGVSLLVSTWSAFRSLEAAREAYYRDYRFADLFAQLERAPRRVAERLAAIPGVQTVAPRIEIEGLVENPGYPAGEPASARFLSIPSDGQPALNRIHLRHGRLPGPSDATEVLVHEGFAQAHGIVPGVELDVLIEGRRERVRAVGIALSPEWVVTVSAGTPLPDDRRYGVFWVPEPSLARLARMNEAFNGVSLALSPGAEPEATLARMDEILRPYGGRGAYPRRQQLSDRFVEDEIRQQRTTSLVSPAVFLGIAAFLVHVIASRLIGLHRGQIATLKAVGYSNAQVATHYLALMTVMMLLGAVPGLALGDGLGRLMALSYRSVFRFPALDFSLNAPAVGIGLVAGVLPGLLGAWSSVRAAFRLAPAEAMRPPAPPSFRAGLLEKLGLRHRLSASQRMVWRNLFARPLRFTLSLVGIALATCVVIVSLAWSDILNYVLEAQFQRVQREDMSVTLLRPVPPSGLRELVRMPGVVAVEGYRVVPVRMRYRHHRREVALTGWPADATMRRRLDDRGKTVPLPERGLLLSRHFETAWRLRVGDTVELETLEGEPRTLSLPVGGFSPDLVGIGASVRIDALWDALGEAPSYNLATLKLDPRASSETYARLKSKPGVTAVNLKSALYRGFQATMGRVITVMSAILIAFALVIAGGVIYNSVRVSYSERSWELASLRVIGFSRSRVFRILMAEVWVQALASLVPGCLLGLALTHAIVNAVHTETFGFPVVIRARSYSIGLLTTLLALLLSAAAVWRLMGRLNLNDALKARE